MKIITINIPLSFLKAMESCYGGDKLVFSRSEFIRNALRSFLERELEAAKVFTPFTHAEVPIQPTLDQKLFVQVPIGSNTNGVPEMKTFRLVKK